MSLIGIFHTRIAKACLRSLLSNVLKMTECTDLQTIFCTILKQREICGTYEDRLDTNTHCHCNTDHKQPQVHKCCVLLSHYSWRRGLANSFFVVVLVGDLLSCGQAKASIACRRDEVYYHSVLAVLHPTMQTEKHLC